MWRSSVLIPAAVSVACGPNGTGFPRDGLRAADSIVSAWVDSGRVPGAVLSIHRDGRVQLERAYGHRQLYDYGGGQYGSMEPAVGWRAPVLTGPIRLTHTDAMTIETRFDLASVTKVMATTFALMMLVDAGDVDLDASVQTYLPGFDGAGRDEVTVRQLLTHTGGLAQWLPIYYHAATPDDAYAYVRRQPLAWAPGEGRHYSDLGFMLLGRLAERASGASLDALLRSRLYGPLGLERTGFLPRGPAVRPTGEGAGAARPLYAATSHGNPFEHHMVHDSTFGYRIDGDARGWDGWRRYTLAGEVNDGNAYHAFGGVAGHAGLFSTAHDLQRLLLVLLNNGVLDGERVLGSSTVAEFLRPQVDGQALGWQVPPYAPPGSFAHTGFTGTFVIGMPSVGVGLVLLTNRQNLGVRSDGRYTEIGELQQAVVEAVVSRRGSAPSS